MKICHMETKVLLKSDPGGILAINNSSDNSSADDGLVTSSLDELNCGKAPPSLGAPAEGFWPEKHPSLPRYVVNASVRDTSEMIYGTAVIATDRQSDKNLRGAFEASSDQLSKRESESSSCFAEGRSEFAFKRCSSLYGNFVIHKKRDSDNITNGVTVGDKGEEFFNDIEFFKERGNIFRSNSVEGVVNAGGRSFRLSQLFVRPNSCPPGFLCFQNMDQNCEFGDALKELNSGERHFEKVYGKCAVGDSRVSAKK